MIHPVVSDQRHHAFLYGHTKHNRKGGGKEKTNRHGLWLTPRVRKGKSVTLWILWNNVSVYSNEMLTSHLQCWHLLALINTACVGQQVLAFIFLTFVDSLLCPASILSQPFSGLLSQADCCLLPFFVNWFSLSSLGYSFPPPLTV